MILVLIHVHFSVSTELARGDAFLIIILVLSFDVVFVAFASLDVVGVEIVYLELLWLLHLL